MRNPCLTWLLSSPFALRLLFAWAWFNTDIARSDSQPSTLNSQPRIWLSARTNIPGYVFIAEPVRESVTKTLGTTNILSGSFYKVADRSPQNGGRSPDTAVRNPTSDLQSPVPDQGASVNALDPRTSTLDT